MCWRVISAITEAPHHQDRSCSLRARFGSARKMAPTMAAAGGMKTSLSMTATQAGSSDRTARPTPGDFSG